MSDPSGPAEPQPSAIEPAVPGYRPQSQAPTFDPPALQFNPPQIVPPGYAGNSDYAVPSAGGTLAGVGRRFVAFLLDGFIMLIAGLVLDIFFGSDTSKIIVDPHVQINIATYLLANLANLVVNLAYYGYFWGTSGQSPGKKVLGIRIVRKDYQPMTLRTGMIRAAMIHVLGMASALATLPLLTSGATNNVSLVVTSVLLVLLGLYQLLDYLWAFWDAQKQTIHDKVAGTVVIRS